MGSVQALDKSCLSRQKIAPTRMSIWQSPIHIQTEKHHMNKKHIVSACAALVGLSAFAAAQAQTNTTLYGLVDYGYTYRWDAKAPGTGTPSSQSQLNGLS